MLVFIVTHHIATSGRALANYKGHTIEVSYRLGNLGKTQGRIVVLDRYHSSTHFKSIKIPASYYVFTDKDYRSVVNIKNYGGACILDVILYSGVGVYEERTVFSYLVNVDPHFSVMTWGKPFTISGDGSWQRVSETDVRCWDADFGERVSHNSPHYYYMLLLRQSKTGQHLVRKLKTMNLYHIEPDEEMHRPRIVPPSQDPLKEFGLRWSWWK